MKKIALFGANGYLGSQIAASFSDNGDNVIGFDLPGNDVTSAAFWATFDPLQYDAILFFAGLTGTESSFHNVEQFISVNELGLMRLLSKLSQYGPKAPYVVFPSSRLIYKGSDRRLREDDPKDARTVYAVNKLACENLLRAYHIRYGIRYSVVRICVPYGSIRGCEYSYGTIGFFIKQAISKGEILLYGDGMLKRTFTHIFDICDVIKRLIDKRPTGVYNIGGDALTLKDVATRIASRHNARVSCVSWPVDALKIESGSTVFDSTKLFNELGKQVYISFYDSFMAGI